jgi:hypothetical protein
MTRILLLMAMAAVFPSAAGASVSSSENDLTRADVGYFFSSVTFNGRIWTYHLSPNTRGMLWRIRDDKSDLTGACVSGGILEVARNANFEVKNKQVDFHVSPWGTHLRATLLIKADPAHGTPAEEREALVSWSSTRALDLVYVED